MNTIAISKTSGAWQARCSSRSCLPDERGPAEGNVAACTTPEAWLHPSCKASHRRCERDAAERTRLRLLPASAGNGLWRHKAARTLTQLRVNLSLLSLLGGSLIQVTAAAQALAPYDVWKQDKFSSEQITDNATSGDLSDPDADGVCNLLEYAFNTEPWTSSIGAQLAASESQASLVYRRNKAASDIGVVVEKATNLVRDVWETQQPTSLTTMSDDGAVQVLKADLPVIKGENTFFRLRVSRASAGPVSDAAEMLIPIENSSFENGLVGWSGVGQVDVATRSPAVAGGGSAALLSQSPGAAEDYWCRVAQTTAVRITGNTDYVLRFAASAAPSAASGEITAKIYAGSGALWMRLVRRTFTVSTINGSENWATLSLLLPAADIPPEMIGRFLRIELGAADGSAVLLDDISLVGSSKQNWIANASFEQGLASWSSAGSTSTRTRPPSLIGGTTMASSYAANAQGRNGWYYRWTSSGLGHQRDSDAYRLDWSPGGASYPNPGFDGDGYYYGAALLRLAAGRIVVSPNYDTWINVRWVSDDDYPNGVALTGAFQRLQSSEDALNDGVTALIQLNGVTKWIRVLSAADLSENTFNLSISEPIRAGDQIDFLVNPNANPYWDNTAITAEILPTALPGAAVPSEFTPDSQGGNGWSYHWSANGSYDVRNDVNVLSWASGGSPYPSPGYDGDGYYDGSVLIKLSDGQLVVAPDFNRWANLRWKSSFNYLNGVVLSGFFQRLQPSDDPANDGVAVEIRVNGVAKWSRVISASDLSQIAFSCSIPDPISEGDQIDFLVNPKGNPFWDNTVINATISPIGRSSTGTDTTSALLGVPSSTGTAGPGGSIAQATRLALELGKDYTLSFWGAAASNSSSSITAKIYAVGVGDLLQETFPVTVTNGAPDWAAFNLTLPSVITSRNPVWAGKTLGVAFSTASGAPVLLDSVSFSPSSAPQIVPSGQFSVQNVVNGSFAAGSLVPWTVSSGSPSVASDNSPFTNVYPANGRALRVSKPLFSSSEGIAASYNFGALGADVVTLNYDFKTSSSANVEDTVSVQNALRTATITSFRMGAPDGGFTLQDGSGTTALTALAANTWYNVQATFNRETWTYSGTITRAGGGTVTWSNRVLLGASTSLACLQLGQANVSWFNSNTTTYDNFSVQSSNEAKHQGMRHRGRAFFPIGVYGSPTPIGQPIVQYAANLQNVPELAANGFNCLHLPMVEISRSTLDHLDEYGMKAIAAGAEGSIRYLVDLAQFQPGSALDLKVRELRGHRALFAYYASDEPLASAAFGNFGSLSYADVLGLLVAGREFLETRDRSRPVLLNEAPFTLIDGKSTGSITYNKRNCMEIATASHAYGMDTYPYVSEASDLTGVAKNVDTCLAVTPSEQPVFAVLQGQAAGTYGGTPTGDRPPLVATRYMAYSAIIHGASGLLWWGTDWLEPDSQAWSDIKSVAREISAIQDVLAAGSENRLFSMESPELICLRKEHEGSTYLIVANRGFSTLTNTTITASGMDLSRNGGRIRVLFEDRFIAPTGDSWKDSFVPWGVHVYTDAPEH